MKNESKTMITYIIAGIIVGMISFYINNNFAVLGFAILVMVALSQVLKKVLKSDEKFKWFFSNGGWVYLFIWFIVWTLMLNLLLYNVI